MLHPDFCKRWDRLSRNEIRTLQGKKLSKFIRQQVYPFSPYYRERFDRAGISPSSFRTFDDLRRIPMISKGDCAPSPEDPARTRKLVLAPNPETLRHAFSPLRLGKMALQKAIRGEAWLKEQLGREYRPSMLIFTTGRSSDPVPFALTLYDLEIMTEVGGRILDVLGVKASEDRGVSVFPYAPHLAFWQVFHCGVARGLMNLCTGGGRVMSTDRILGSIEKLKPTLISGIPGYVYHMFRQGDEQNRDLSSIRLVLLGGDRVSLVMRQRIAEILERHGARDPQVLSVYGFTESRICFPECPAPDLTGFHTFPDLCIFEVIDPDSGEPVGEGEPGELVYTALDGRGTVVLRYRTGDIAEGGITYAPCSYCGKTVPRILGPMSRRSSVVDYRLSKIKGTLVNLDHVSSVIADQDGIDEWQLVIGKKNDDPLDIDQLTLYLSADGKKSEAEIRNELDNRLRSELEVGVNHVRFVSRDELLDRIGMETLMKEQRVVDKRAELENRAPSSVGSNKSSQSN